MQQATVLTALHRRVVLDDARARLVRKYDFSLQELTLPRPINFSPTRHAELLTQLKAQVRERLNADDSQLLSDNALNMIFDNNVGTIRDDGNAAAHEATTEEMALAVLETSLSQSQREGLQRLYKFTHNVEPNFD